MTVEYPSPGIVQLRPDDNVTISRHLDHVFWGTLFGFEVSQLALGLQVQDEVPADGVVEDVSPHHPEPAPVLVDGMGDGPLVADQDDLHPLVPLVREVQHVGTLAVRLGWITSEVTLNWIVSSRTFSNELFKRK